ncbi:ribonuclease III [Sphingosinicella soli]|uniref:Ribonuclease 3 n=1 Tax=Sphingosinicella soli TaxID=333708 RepID=A0A7W7F5C8_9SPHN|nr:ribonuclease III [Sphingosinicella soli]MBB4631146.1 ribonuclease-3 [Sphingosinicella soli]
MESAAWALKALGHEFADPKLLESALTHGGGRKRNYERLEFLGDRVLGCVVAAWLYHRFDETEGELARRFAALVDKGTCAEVARAIGVPAIIRMEPAARQAGVHRSDNVLGDICEALIGALYVDGGLPVAEAFIRAQWAAHVDRRSTAPRDPKSALQEWAQGQRLPIPVYEVVERSGPDHAPSFRVRVTVRGYAPADADGSSKQEAEKQAAIALLARETGE